MLAIVLASSVLSAASASATADCALSSSATTAESCDVRTPSCALDCAMSDCSAAMRVSTAAFSSAGSSADAGATATSERTSPRRASRRRPIGLVSPTDRSTLPRVALERLQSRRDVAPENADLRAVVLVRHGPGAMVELELLERRERAIALLEQLEMTELALAKVVERVGLGLGLAQERERNHDDAGDGERRGEHESQRQRVAGRPTVEARPTRRRCSRRSGHRVITEPRRNTSPASQMRLTSGLTKTRK